MTFTLIQGKINFPAVFEQFIARRFRFTRRAARIIRPTDQLHRRIHSIQVEKGRALSPEISIFNRITHILAIPMLEILARILV